MRESIIHCNMKYLGYGWDRDDCTEYQGDFGEDLSCPEEEAGGDDRLSVPTYFYSTPSSRET